MSISWEENQRKVAEVLVEEIKTSKTDCLKFRNSQVNFYRRKHGLNLDFETLAIVLNSFSKQKLVGKIKFHDLENAQIELCEDDHADPLLFQVQLLDDSEERLKNVYKNKNEAKDKSIMVWEI